MAGKVVGRVFNSPVKVFSDKIFIWNVQHKYKIWSSQQILQSCRGIHNHYSLDFITYSGLFAK